MSEITRKHWLEFFIRISLFILAICTYFIENAIFDKIVLFVIWVFFIYKMIRRIITPNKIDSMGNQKLFEKNYSPTGVSVKRNYLSVLQSGIVWILLNIIFWVLYFCDVVNSQFMFLLSMFYSVCDLICVLIICPFQKIFMRNKCCNTCRIYNWGFPMMFTPLLVVPSVYNYTLVGLSLIVLVHWEYHYFKYPERFHEESNKNLQCQNCKELMCKNKLRKV